MRIGVLKMALAVSLVFNLSVLAATGYVHYTKNNTWLSPLGVRMPKDKFLFEEMGLRPDQMKRMRETAIPFRARIDGKRQEIAAKRTRLFDLMRADNPDSQAIKAAVAEISRIQGEVETMVTAHILQEKATLGKDQQKRFLDLIENAMSKGSQPGCPSVMQNR